MGDAALHTQETDAAFMQRAIELSERAAGRTSPNPLVGCVIVNDGKIVGEGYHQQAGGPHAEIVALKNAGEAARNGSVYVTLEPCNHTGKTPPCTAAIIASGAKEVIYAVDDPNPVAAGGGDALQRAGLTVRSGVARDTAEYANRFWLQSIKQKKPYVIAKFAMSLDGKIATRTGDSKWITNEKSRQRAHDLRHICDGVIVGVNTIIADDPALTVRHGIEAPSQPLRIVLDTNGRAPLSAQVFDRAAPGALLVSTDALTQRQRNRYEDLGVVVCTVAKDEHGRPDLSDLLERLYEEGLRSVMIEGGAGILGSAFDADLVDEVWAFVAPTIIGGIAKTPIGGIGAASVSDALRLTNTKTEQLGADILLRGQVQRER